MKELERAKAATAKIREGRRELESLIHARGERAVLNMILDGETAAPNGGTSNLNRALPDFSHLIGERPSLSWAIQLVIQEDGNGGPLSTDAIYAGLGSRNWLPAHSKDPRPYVSRVLSGDSKVFVRVGRGSYKLSPSINVPPFPDMSEEDATSSDGLEVLPRVIQVLQKAQGPITIADIVKATSLSSKTIQGPIMTLLANGVLKKGRKTSPTGRPLFSVNEQALEQYQKN